VSGFRLALEPAVWTYVIVHELLHFDIPNHGKLWKSLMRAHVGDWALRGRVAGAGEQGTVARC